MLVKIKCVKNTLYTSLDGLKTLKLYQKRHWSFFITVKNIYISYKNEKQIFRF